MSGTNAAASKPLSAPRVMRRAPGEWRGLVHDHPNQTQRMLPRHHATLMLRPSRTGRAPEAANRDKPAQRPKKSVGHLLGRALIGQGPDLTFACGNLFCAYPLW